MIVISTLTKNIEKRAKYRNFLHMILEEILMPIAANKRSIYLYCLNDDKRYEGCNCNQNSFDGYL